MDIIKKFQQSSWARKGVSMAKDSGKMMLLLSKLGTYMKKGGVASIKDDLTTLYGYVRDIASARYRDYNSSSLALIVAALAYLVSPFDFVADFIPFGLVDDVAIISWALNRLGDELLRYRQWREGTKEEGE
ncbi:MAG: DUF1232 domain-containing protein [Bacteroidaceae bacterium]|nr:DUF1232 domain-containing protein [Bacteroidaceae bacterium]